MSQILVKSKEELDTSIIKGSSALSVNTKTFYCKALSMQPELKQKITLKVISW